MRNSFLFFLLFLTSCGYRFGRSQNNERINISVPYIQGDFSAYFTNELIKQVSYSPNLNYKYSNADYILCVKIIDSNTSTIGTIRALLGMSLPDIPLG